MHFVPDGRKRVAIETSVQAHTLYSGLALEGHQKDCGISVLKKLYHYTMASTSHGWLTKRNNAGLGLDCDGLPFLLNGENSPRRCLAWNLSRQRRDSFQNTLSSRPTISDCTYREMNVL